MNDDNIIKILAEQNESSSFTKLIPNNVQRISKNITSILYNSLHSKTTSHKTERLNLLLLLQKWGSFSGNHMNINFNNYDCIVDYLACAFNIFDNDTEENLTTDEGSNTNITKSVIEFHKKLNITHESNQKFIDNIKILDKKKYKNDTIFDFDFSSKAILRSKDFAQLSSLCDQNCCTDLYKPVEKLPQSFSHKEQVYLAYSLLNLCKTDTVINLLSRIINCYDGKQMLQSYEVEFINYLWQNYDDLGIPEYIPIALLERFRFIYEKCFITLCTNTLKDNNRNDKKHISGEVEKILKFCMKNKRISNSITSLLYELYACSGYNNKLNGLLTLLHH